MCLKYGWAHDNHHLPFQSKPNRREIIFIFNRVGLRTGGLGDRLAGLISAYAYSLRTNRTFILSLSATDTGLIKAFQPKNRKSNIQIHITKNESHLFGNDTLDLRSCFNPSNISCTLDTDYPHKTIIISINRAYLCRWAELIHIDAYQQLLQLGITNNSNLYEVAGCMLRQILWPTKSLWDAVDIILNKFPDTDYRIALQYRCGDDKSTSCLKKANWPGGDSLYDTANCGNTLLNSLNETISKYIYITTDYHEVTLQMAAMLDFSLPYENVLLAPKSCHIDGDRSSICTFNTIIYWFIMSLSDTIIASSSARDTPTERISTDRTSTASTSAASDTIPLIFSAFPKYAVIYSLANDSFHFPHICMQHVDLSNMSHYSSGNWMCGASF